MTLLEFLKHAHRWTGGAPIRGFRDPLHAFASLVRENAANPRARVVLRILIALRDGAGEFEEKDVWALDSERQQLLTALLHDQLAGRYNEAEFASVVDRLDDPRKAERD